MCRGVIMIVLGFVFVQLGNPAVGQEVDVEHGRRDSATSVAGDSNRPNIVFILSDDQAWTDYGFMGHPEIKTPHLDTLAARSLVFERGYVASPLCRPSLASMVTGLYPFQHGVTGNDVDGKHDRAMLDAPVQRAFHRHPSFIKHLTSHGYLAHQSGKWWEGSWQDGGFTHGMTHGDPRRGGRHGDAGLSIGRTSMTPVTNFIDQATEAKRPFLVWYAPFLPHSPHNPPQRLLNKYRHPDRAEDVARYYAMCEWFDESCGELLAHLEQRELIENTVVIYICDNGWAAASTNADDPHQKNWKSYALRSKGSPYEQGIRTPIMISWPKKISPRRTQSLAHAIDIFPTIAAVTEIAPPDNLPGVSWFDDQACRDRTAVFGVCHSVHNMTPGDPDGTLQYLWSVQGEWKLIQRYHGLDTTQYRELHHWDTAPVRLYHLGSDPNELNDLAGEQGERVSQLMQVMEAWHRPAGSVARTD